MPKDNVITFPLRDSQPQSRLARARKLPARNSAVSHTVVPWLSSRSFGDVYADWLRRGGPGAGSPKKGNDK